MASCSIYCNDQGCCEQSNAIDSHWLYYVYVEHERLIELHIPSSRRNVRGDAEQTHICSNQHNIQFIHLNVNPVFCPSLLKTLTSTSQRSLHQLNTTERRSPLSLVTTINQRHGGRVCWHGQPSSRERKPLQRIAQIEIRYIQIVKIKRKKKPVC